MKYVFLLSAILLFSNIFAQKGKKDAELVIIWQQKYDSILLKLEQDSTLLHFTIDSLNAKLQKHIKTSKPKVIQPEVELNLTTTLIGNDQWAISNFGGISSVNPTEKEQILEFLISKKFNECRTDEEWANYLELNSPAFFVLGDTLNSLGFYFNVPAIYRLESILEGTEWRIAKYNDFSNLYNNVATLSKKLGLTNFSPLQLIAGNIKDETLVKKIKWNMKVVDIYNLNLFPFTYYTGFTELLGDEDYIEYFSNFDQNGNVVVTHISPDNKLPFQYAYGSESLNYGFLIRLIKNK
jgi:hypothetical protein